MSQGSSLSYCDKKYSRLRFSELEKFDPKLLSEVGVEARKKPEFAVFASSHGVRTPTKANFKLAVIYNQLLKP